MHLFWFIFLSSQSYQFFCYLVTNMKIDMILLMLSMNLKGNRCYSKSNAKDDTRIGTMESELA
jgi:hypothetical protein